MKGGKYANTLAKIQLRAMYLIPDIRIYVEMLYQNL